MEGIADYCRTLKSSLVAGVGLCVHDHPNKGKGEIPGELHCFQCPWQEGRQTLATYVTTILSRKRVMFQIWERHQKHSYSVHVFLIMMLVFLSHVSPTVTIYGRKVEAIWVRVHFLRLPIERNPHDNLEASKSVAFNIFAHLRVNVLLFALTND